VFQLIHASRFGTLASARATWQGSTMPASPPPRSPLAGGSLIALGAILGAVIGLSTAFGPTRGFLAGLSAGVAMSLAIWLLDRKRDR
jgi:hypothetical protein